MAISDIIRSCDIFSVSTSGTHKKKVVYKNKYYDIIKILIILFVIGLGIFTVIYPRNIKRKVTSTSEKWGTRRRNLGINEPQDYNLGVAVNSQNINNSTKIKIEKNKIGNWWLQNPSPIGNNFLPFAGITYAFKPNFILDPKYNNVGGFIVNSIADPK